MFRFLLTSPRPSTSLGACVYLDFNGPETLKERLTDLCAERQPGDVPCPPRNGLRLHPSVRRAPALISPVSECSQEPWRGVGHVCESVSLASIVYGIEAPCSTTSRPKPVLPRKHHRGFIFRQSIKDMTKCAHRVRTGKWGQQAT